MFILSGGGDEFQSFKIHKLFADNLKSQRNLLYIPGDAFPYEASFKWISKVFSSFGITNIKMWTDINEKIDCKDFDGIYVGGGNTFNLLEKLSKSKMFSSINSYLNLGGVYFGGSAGAALLSKDINVCLPHDPNENNVFPTLGLNKLLGYDLWCHYNVLEEPLIKEWLKNNPKLILLKEESGIICDGNTITALGDVIVCKDGKREEVRDGGGVRL